MSETTVHLLVLIHGMWGNPDHCAELADTARATCSTEGIELQVLVAETNRAESTHDGIDWGGERVAKEVTDKISELEASGKKVTKFSVTGYSLGGLVGRYLVGILFHRKFFDTVTAVNFCTIATPNIGLPQAPTFLSAILSSWAPRLSRTGKQFYCADEWGASKQPLLQVMADPGQIFYLALAKFSHLSVYANAINDRTVSFLTAAIEIENPFTELEKSGIEVELDEKYSPVIRSYKFPAVPPPPTPKPIILSPGWFRNRKKQPKFFLPLFLQARFPFNLAVYAFLPAIIPLVVSILLVYLPFGAYYSRARIRLLENDESNNSKLIDAFEELERNVEDAVVDMIDNPGPIQSSSTAGPNPLPENSTLTPLQHQIAASLNKLPIKKHMAYIENVANSHAVIVCRDINRFEGHRVGKGVVQHWAKSLNL